MRYRLPHELCISTMIGIMMVAHNFGKGRQTKINHHRHYQHHCCFHRYHHQRNHYQHHCCYHYRHYLISLLSISSASLLLSLSTLSHLLIVNIISIIDVVIIDIISSPYCQYHQHRCYPHHHHRYPHTLIISSSLSSEQSK